MGLHFRFQSVLHIPINNEWKWLKCSPCTTCNKNRPTFVNASNATKANYGCTALEWWSGCRVVIGWYHKDNWVISTIASNPFTAFSLTMTKRRFYYHQVQLQLFVRSDMERFHPKLDIEPYIASLGVTEHPQKYILESLWPSR